MTKKIWVTGAAGYMGKEFVTRLTAMGYDVVGTDKEVTVCDPDRVKAYAGATQPNVIINCAGIPRSMTGISNRIKAYEVNALGARNVALAAQAVGAKVVQISTDDVFPSRMREAVNEFDNPHPESPYGKSKRAGETMVRDTTPDHLIIRSSWVYATEGGILMDVIKAFKSGKPYEARTDQYASPTSISMYTDFMVKAIENNATGVLHIAGRGCTNRYGFAAKAMELCGYEPTKYLVPTTDLVTAETIELESLMLAMFGAELPTWEDGLKAYLTEVGLMK